MATINDTNDDALAQLLHDLKTKPTLCRVDDYAHVTVEALNATVFFDDDGFYTPCRPAVDGLPFVAAKISACVGNWATWMKRGRVMTSSGAFLRERGAEGPTVRMPDVSYTPYADPHKPTPAQTLTLRGEPFVPTLVVEIDTLVGHGSNREELDAKMRNFFFPHGVQLGWLVDPEHRIMVEYFADENGAVQCSSDKTWRNLSGRNVLPEFELDCIEVALVMHQAPGSSLEEEDDEDANEEMEEKDDEDKVANEEMEEDDEEVETEEYVCPLAQCGNHYRSVGQLLCHVEQHRCDVANKKFLKKTKREHTR